MSGRRPPSRRFGAPGRDPWRREESQ
jgi:hypothetical protein